MVGPVGRKAATGRILNAPLGGYPVVTRPGGIGLFLGKLVVGLIQLLRRACCCGFVIVHKIAVRRPK
jgi:hypothetical protein